MHFNRWLVLFGGDALLHSASSSVFNAPQYDVAITASFFFLSDENVFFCYLHSVYSICLSYCFSGNKLSVSNQQAYQLHMILLIIISINRNYLAQIKKKNLNVFRLSHTRLTSIWRIILSSILPWISWHQKQIFSFCFFVCRP